MEIMQSDLSDGISDAEILLQTLPPALNETVIRFTFKSNIPTIFGTLQHDQIDMPSEVQEDRQGFLWVFDTIAQEWHHIDLDDIATAIDIDSIAEVDAEK